MHKSSAKMDIIIYILLLVFLFQPTQVIETISLKLPDLPKEEEGGDIDWSEIQKPFISEPLNGSDFSEITYKKPEQE